MESKTTPHIVKANAGRGMQRHLTAEIAFCGEMVVVGRLYLGSRSALPMLKAAPSRSPTP